VAELMALAEARGLLESVYSAHYGSGLLAYHRNDLARARHYFQLVIAHRYVTHPVAVLSSYMGLALIAQTEGEAEESLRLITEAVTFVDELNNPGLVHTLRSCQALLALLQGRNDDAIAWAERVNRQLPFVPNFWLEVAHLTLVKCLLTQNSTASLAEAATLLPALQEKCRIYGARLLLAELLILEACLYERRNERANALALLEEAVILAQANRPLRLFADLGLENSRILAGLLAEIAERGVAPDYIRRLLAALPLDAAPAPPSSPHFAQELRPVAMAGSAPPVAARQQGLIEPLTPRELEILSLLAQGLPNKEIGQQLFIAPKTVERHTLNIYAKLGVKNRTQAVARAREIDLLLR
jgi:LuxR family maltose regulon positive regulatory protein